ncbi:MAG TPA: NUDIX domain-containing protein [Terriglobales bacterium]|nr:NUDIX domain-containing protein [Terriglobales bacterium]
MACGELGYVVVSKQPTQLFLRKKLRMSPNGLREILTSVRLTVGRAVLATAERYGLCNIEKTMPENLPRIGSALLLCDQHKHILLGKRNKDPQRGSWVIPGGKIHAFERIAEAAAREIFEETGLTVLVGRQFGIYEIINPPSEHRLVIYSWGRLVCGTPKASDDLSEVRFFSPEELEGLPVTPLVRRVLADAGFVTRAGVSDQEHSVRSIARGLVRDLRSHPSFAFDGSIAVR